MANKIRREGNGATAITIAKHVVEEFEKRNGIKLEGKTYQRVSGKRIIIELEG